MSRSVLAPAGNGSHTVFNTALYHYATRGEAGLGFSEEILSGGVRRTASAPG